MTREIKWLWRFRLGTPSLLMYLHQVCWYGIPGCTVRRDCQQVFDLTDKALHGRFELGMTRSHPWKVVAGTVKLKGVSSVAVCSASRVATVGASLVLVMVR